MDSIKLQFTYANSFKGRLVTWVQFLLGVKHWRLAHVQVMTPTGIYSYNSDTVILGLYQVTDISHIVRLCECLDDDYHQRALNFVRCHGYYSLSNVLEANCVTFAVATARLNPYPRLRYSILPGKLYEQLTVGKYATGYDCGCTSTSDN
jgi:hypothetical protein